MVYHQSSDLWSKNKDFSFILLQNLDNELKNLLNGQLTFDRIR